MIGYFELKPGAWWKKLSALTPEEEKTGYSLRGERQSLFLLMWGQLIWSHASHWTLKSRVCTEHHGLVRGSPCGTFLVAISQDVDITGWDEMWNCKTFQWSQTPRSKLKIPLRFALGSREKRGRLCSTWTRVDITSHGRAATRSPYVPLNDNISTSASAPPTLTTVRGAATQGGKSGYFIFESVFWRKSPVFYQSTWNSLTCCGMCTFSWGWIEALTGSNRMGLWFLEIWPQPPPVYN